MCFTYSKVCRSVLLMGKYLFKVSKKTALDAHCFSAFTVKNTLKWDEIQQNVLPTATPANSGGIYVSNYTRSWFLWRKKNTLPKWTFTYCYSATGPN